MRDLIRKGDFVSSKFIPEYVDYLTPSKKYEIVSIGDKGVFNILDDDERITFCIIKGCAHLDGENWTIHKKS